MRTLGRLRYFVASPDRRLGAAAGGSVGLLYVLVGLVHREAVLSSTPGELFRAVVVAPLLSGDPGPWLVAVAPAAAAGVAVAAGEVTVLPDREEALATEATRSLLAAVPVSTALGVLAVGFGQVVALLVDAYLEFPLFGVFHLVLVYLDVVVGNAAVVGLAVAVYAAIGCAAAGAGYAVVRLVADGSGVVGAESTR